MKKPAPKNIGGRRVGRPPSLTKDTDSMLHVDIPGWLKEMCDESARKEGRLLRHEIARRLKVSFGLSPDADEPPKPR
jgi:hypothetical protein